MPTKSTAPMSVDEATVRLAETERLVVSGQAGPDDLLAARGAVDVARLREAEAERIAELRAMADNVDAIQAEIDWLGGPELVALLDKYTAAHVAALDALTGARLAWGELTAGFHGHMRILRQLGASGTTPPGVEVTPLIGFDVQVDTAAGSWNSASSLREDPVRYLVEGSADLARGRQPRSNLLDRLRRWHQRGVGVPLPAPGADEEEGAA